MSRYVLDIEANGFLRDVTRTWIIGPLDINTKELTWSLEGDSSWKDKLSKAKLLVGHNIIGYDLPVLLKIHDWEPTKGTLIHDTLIMSQVQNYMRFGFDGHSLDDWGKFLKFPKGEFSDFSQYSEEMLEYWKIDMKLTDKVYDYLLRELHMLTNGNPDHPLKTYLRVEHAVAKWCAKAELNGWPFDLDAAVSHFEKMTIEMNAVRERLLPRLGMKTVAVDKKLGVVEAKKVRWTKIGAYNHHVANWFGIDPYSGQDEDRLVEGDYCRVEFKPLDVDSVADVKIFLFRNGWQPTDWNYKTDEYTNKKVKTSPKITEDSLEFLEGDGKLYCDFLTTKSRYGVLNGWIEAVDDNGVIHGECMTVGTPSMRARHNLIVNVPAADSIWGPEFRSLFRCKPGWKLIGCDSAGNQARGLAHYLKSDEFTHQLLHGDIHTYNAKVLTEALDELGIKKEVERSRAKRALYATLFGASGAKLFMYCMDYRDEELGKKLKNLFLKKIPGFKSLMDKLNKIYGSTSQTGNGYIPGIGGNRIYCDSFHKLLVYLLQACEKATCGAALMLTVERLEEAGIPYLPTIFMHDEIDFQVPEEFVEQAAAIGKKAFQDGPKMFGVTIMDGDAKIGNNWYEVH